MKVNSSINELPVVGSIATMPTRIHTFAKILPEILKQVDLLYIYLDGFKKIPTGLQEHPKCRPFIMSDDNNLHTCNRFLAPNHFALDATIVLFDDDIFYPPDYVSRIKAALAKYGERSVVGFHGAIFCPPHTSYARDRIGFHFANARSNDTLVHILGTGTAAFLSSVFRPDPRHWLHQNMADLYLAAEAFKSNLSLVSLKRDAKWLIPLEQNQDDSIWRSVQKDDSIQSSFMSDLLLQYANNQWRSWWKIAPDLSGISEEPKLKIEKNKELSFGAPNQTITIKKVLNFKMGDSLPSGEPSAKYVPFTVGDRKRYATCSGVAWISNRMLVTVNLYGQHLRVYEVSDESKNGSMSLIYENARDISFPESVTISPNKKLMAISHTMSATKGLSIQTIECNDGFEIKSTKDIRKGTYHSLAFSPNSRFLAATEIGQIGFVEIIDTMTERTTFLQPSRLSPLRPKSVAIAPDGEFLVIISGAVVKPTNTEESSISVLSLHRFNQNAGIFEDIPVAELEFANGKYVSIEDCCVIASHQGSHIFNLICVDQANDKIQKFSCNTHTFEIHHVGTISENVSFPHGIDVSPSGKNLAVANYGDNSIRIIYL